VKLFNLEAFFAMLAGNYNMTCQQGSTFSRTIEIEQPDLASDPTGNTFIPFDLSGYTARMQVRRTIDSSNVLLELTTSNGGLTVNPIEGDTNKIFLYASANVTASVSTSGVYDIEIISAENIVSRVLQGTFNLSPEVTR
jgi:hypothetical protein